MSREEKRALQMKIAQMVDDSLANRSFKIDMNYMIPNGMPSRNLEYGYYIRVNNDSIDAYIPFFGVAYRAEYGTDDGGLSYKGPMASYQVSQVRKDLRQVNIIVKKHFDEILYQIDVFTNGRASIFVRSLNREGIQYNGEMTINN
jgi:hypothetical protein